jgi:hypothetical protein
LEQVRPDLLEQVVDGRLSAHAAMMEAGLRKRSFTIPHDASRVAEILCEHFDTQALRIIEHRLKLELLPAPDPDPPASRGPKGSTKTWFYAVVDNEEVSKHSKMSNAFRALDQHVRERAKRGEPVREVYVQQGWGQCFF